MFGSTGVNADAPLGDILIGVSWRADAAYSADGVVAIHAFAVESIDIEYLVDFASVAVIIRTCGDLYCGSAVEAILGVGCNSE